MLVAVYPGTFDPFTLGHADIVGRAMRLVDRLVVAVAGRTRKKVRFPVGERVDMVRECIAARSDSERIEVRTFDTLLVRAAREYGARLIVRGLRSISDFEHEAQLAEANRRLDNSMETLFLMADPRVRAISSRLVKEIAVLGGDVSAFVPDGVRRRLTAGQ